MNTNKDEARRVWVVVSDDAQTSPKMRVFSTKEKAEDAFTKLVREDWDDEYEFDGDGYTFEECVDSLSYYDGGQLVIKAYETSLDVPF